MSLWRHHYITKRNFGVCFYRYLKFNQISIEWWSEINLTMNRSGVIVILKCLILVVEIRDSRESGTVTCHVSLFKCPGWKFVGNVYNLFCAFFGLCLSWWMFQWRSGALARAQMSDENYRKFANFRTLLREYRKW